MRLCRDYQCARATVNSQASAKAGCRQPGDVGNLLAKAALELGGVIRADCVTDSYVQGPILCDTASNIAHETRDAVSLA